MTNKTHCPERQKLKSVLVDGVANVEASQIEAHLLECADCAQATLKLSADDTLVRSLRHNSPNDSTVAASREVVQRLIQHLQQLPNQTDTLAPAVEPGRLGCLENEWKSSFSSAEADDELGRLNGFRILKLLGQGGMGGVFLAEDLKLGRRVALKVMRRGVAAQADAAERFIREARAVAAVHNPHVVTIYQVGEDRGVPFFAQELLQGESLDALLKRESMLPIADVISIGRQIAAGLAAAHEQNLIHRDIKPANVWLETSGNVKLLDFGLARPLGSDQELTQSGAILGTPAYMAPEQARSEDLDARSDLFSLGCVLYRMSTGEEAFRGKDVMSTLMALATVEPSSPQTVRADVPRELSDLIMRLLAKNRDARPASAHEVERQLADMEIATPSTVEAAPARRNPNHAWLIGAGFAATCVLLGVIIITVKDRHGRETKISVSTPNDVKIVKVEQEPDSTPAAPENAFSLSGLDPSKIPEEERVDSQPVELVAVIGQHRLRDWWQATSVVIHPSGSFLIEASERNTQFWSLDTLQRLNGNAGGAIQAGCTFTPDGKSCINGRARYSVDLSRPDSPRIKESANRPPRKVREQEQIVISPDAKWMLLAGSPAGILEVWDLSGDGFRFVKELPYAGRSSTSFLQLSRDGRRLALRGDGADENSPQAIRLFEVDWDAADGPALKPFGEPIPGLTAVLSADGQRLVAADELGNAKLLNLTEMPPRVEAEFQSAGTPYFFSDGKRLAHNAGHISILEASDGVWNSTYRLPTATGTNSRFWVSPDEKTLIVSEYFVGHLRVWDLTTDPPRERGASISADSMAFSPDGRMLAINGWDHSTVWNLTGAQPEQVKTVDQGPAQYPPSFSYDSRLVAFSHVGTDVWDLSAEPPAVISSGKDIFHRFAQTEPKVEIWSDKYATYPYEITERGSFRVTPPIETGFVSPDTLHDPLAGVRAESGRCVRVLADGKLGVINLKDGTQIVEVQHPAKIVNHFCLSASGDVLAAFSGNQTMVWDLAETPPREYPLPDTNSSDALFSSDGKLLLVARGGGGIQLYDWAAGRHLRDLEFPGWVRQMFLHPDNRHLGTVNGNGTIYILRIPEFQAKVDK